MATVKTTRAAADAPAFKPTGGGYRAVAVGSIVLGADLFTAPETTGPLNGDIYQMCKLPKGAVVFGGRFRSSRIASGTPPVQTTLALNFGLTGAFTDFAGVSYGAASASVAFGSGYGMDYSLSSLGTVKMESGVNFPLGGLLLTVGPLTLSEEQFAQVKFVGSATSFISRLSTMLPRRWTITSRDVRKSQCTMLDSICVVDADDRKSNLALLPCSRSSGRRSNCPSGRALAIVASGPPFGSIWTSSARLAGRDLGHQWRL